MSFGQPVKSKRGKSLHRLLHGDEAELFEWFCKVGFLCDSRLSPCPKCGEKRLKFESAPDGNRIDGATYVCPRLCCHRESVIQREADIFLARVPLSKQMFVIYLYIYHKFPGPDQLAFDAELDDRVVLKLLDNVKSLVTWWMLRANAVLQIGGKDEDVEADEASFRNIKVMNADG